MSTTYLVQGSETLVSDETVPSLAPSLSRLGQGASRIAYRLDSETVLKVTYARCFAGDCGTEVEVWETAPSYEKKYLAKILAHGNGWLVMERVCCVGDFCEDCWDGDGYAWREAVGEMEDALGAMGVGDLHNGNYGTTSDGRVVAIDYAFSGADPEDSCLGGHGSECPCPSCCWDCRGDGSACCEIHEVCKAPTWCAQCDSTVCDFGTCGADAVAHVRRPRGTEDYAANPWRGPWTHAHYCEAHATTAHRMNAYLATPEEALAAAVRMGAAIDARRWEMAGQARLLGNLTLRGFASYNRKAPLGLGTPCCGKGSAPICGVCARRVRLSIARLEARHG